jgi:lipoprotein-anchoring transpeptidase ErfK/SrfK
MHATRTHRRIVYFFGSAILILLALFFLAVLGIGVFSLYSSPAEAPVETFTVKILRAPATPFLEEKEAVVVEPTTKEGNPTVMPVEKVLFEYVEVKDGCGVHFEGACLNVRAGPGTEYPVVAQLRNNMVLKIGGAVERDGQTWYKIVFDETLRYPERVASDWYVAAEYVNILLDEGDRTVWDHGSATNTKRIVVDRSEQKLYAYDGDVLFMEMAISTGLELTPTPRGTFTIFKKTPSRYMQGPLPGIADQYYDLPGVPWNLYFTKQGAVIHGAYWHNSFGSAYSHGCVNLPPNKARELYNWAELGTTVIVRD